MIIKKELTKELTKGLAYETSIQISNRKTIYYRCNDPCADRMDRHFTIGCECAPPVFFGSDPHDCYFVGVLCRDKMVKSVDEALVGIFYHGGADHRRTGVPDFWQTRTDTRYKTAHGRSQCADRTVSDQRSAGQRTTARTSSAGSDAVGLYLARSPLSCIYAYG